MDARIKYADVLPPSLCTLLCAWTARLRKKRRRTRTKGRSAVAFLFAIDTPFSYLWFVWKEADERYGWIQVRVAVKCPTPTWPQPERTRKKIRSCQKSQRAERLVN